MKTICFALSMMVICLSQAASADDTASSIPPQRPNTYWGASTNGIMAGIYAETTPALSNVDDLTPVRINILLYNSSTNNGNIMPNMTMLLAPPLEDRYKLDLRDENGKEIKKTPMGKSLGVKSPQPYKPKANPSTGITIDTGWRPGEVFLPSREVRELTPPLLLSDYFVITNSGKYHLHCKISLFKPRKDDINKQDLLCLPPVNAEIEIKLNEK